MVTQVGEFTVDDGGQLDLGLPDSELPSPALLSPTDADDWVDEGWIPGDYGDPETDPDDSEAWLASLPADIRAEYLAGAWTGDGETIPAGFLHHLRSGPGGVGFASGGVLDEMVPGSWLGDALVTATAEGDDRLGESELIGVLCAWRRMSSWAAAGETAAVMELVRRRQARSEGPGDSRLADHINDELAAALTLTGRSADRLISMSFGLARLDVVYAALRRGEIDWAKACLFVSELAVLADDDVAREIASRLLARAGAGAWTTGQLRAALRRAVLAADPKSADRRRHEARKDAEVQSWDEASGNAALAGRELPPADVIAADSRLTALARWLQDHGATGTISQLRAEVYLALLADRPVESLLPGLVDGQGGSAGQDGSVGHGQAADQGGSAGQGQSTEEGQPADEGQPASAADSRQDRGSRPADRAHAWPAVSGSIHLTMPLAALLGGGQPGEVAGRGPVDASTCREIAAMLASGSGTRWSLTVTGADGRAVGHASARSGPAAGEPVLRWAVGLRSKLQFLESGDCSHARQSARYRPPASLRNLVMVRQRRCAFPGCRRPAIRCDLDHTVPFDEGGRSCECNLAPLCRRHHQAKQAPGWCLEQLRPGAMTWRMPSGRCYQTAGEPYPI
ncbi:MAG TPA: HNH endonuclease signature motif containing protein [Streptosporangiaceae bacterium]|nr:HNH endonuclease signature motif containing protein [Streptosporangiaceae bacterium]